jgi:predicted HicB family RNase H-like nuclease
MYNKKLFLLKHKNMKKAKNDSKRVNLTIDNEFYTLLKKKADEDFIKLGTWVKQFLKQNVKNNIIKN